MEIAKSKTVMLWCWRCPYCAMFLVLADVEPLPEYPLRERCVRCGSWVEIES